MSKWLFWGGITLYAYDAASHLYCYIAEVLYDNGHSGLAYLWNTYASNFYPMYQGRAYDLHWTIVHWTAIALLVSGYLTKRALSAKEQ